jgi:lysophospholipase L1-like esterase
MDKVLLIGDSIRMGYEDIVRRGLEGVAEVWAPKENGRDSRNVLAHAESWMARQSATLIHVNCGLHDIKRPPGSVEPAVPLQEYRRNVRQILTGALESGATAIWALTTPVNQEWHHENKPFDRFQRDVIAYNGAAAAIARELGAEVEDLYQLIMHAGRDRLLLHDGVHYNVEGYRLLGDAVAERIRLALSDRAG